MTAEGKIPLTCRGLTTPATEEKLPSRCPATKPPPLPSVFLSYASADRAAAPGLARHARSDRARCLARRGGARRRRGLGCQDPEPDPHLHLFHAGHLRHHGSPARGLLPPGVAPGGRAHARPGRRCHVSSCRWSSTTRAIPARRVPEKFLSVQWLRVPGGAATPELRQLADRLVAGDTHAHPTRAGRRPGTGNRPQGPQEGPGRARAALSGFPALPGKRVTKPGSGTTSCFGPATWCMPSGCDCPAAFGRSPRL